VTRTSATLNYPPGAPNVLVTLATLEGYLPQLCRTILRQTPPFLCGTVVPRQSRQAILSPLLPSKRLHQYYYCCQCQSDAYAVEFDLVIWLICIHIIDHSRQTPDLSASAPLLPYSADKIGPSKHNTWWSSITSEQSYSLIVLGFQSLPAIRRITLSGFKH
jgi:hypothetical protein